jgi:hypothetical protein
VIRVREDLGEGLRHAERGQQSHVLRGRQVVVDDSRTGDGRDLRGEVGSVNATSPPSS